LNIGRNNEEKEAMSKVAYVKAIVVPVALGLAAVGQTSTADADVRNTYSGAKCVSSTAEKAKNLQYAGGVLVTGEATEVVCPIVKAIFNSTKKVTVAVAASGGTRCILASHEVFTFDSKLSEPKTFPGTDISGLEFEIPESFRGATELVCTLQPNDRILNYLVREFD
jgi:hypothetical protein